MSLPINRWPSRAQDESNRLHGHAEAVWRWGNAGADLILGGHIHLPYVLGLHEQFVDLPRKFWAVQAGTAVSSRVRYEVGNSVNLIRYHGVAEQRRELVIEQWDYDTSQQSFHPVAIHNLDTSTHRD